MNFADDVIQTEDAFEVHGNIGPCPCFELEDDVQGRERFGRTLVAVESVIGHRPQRFDGGAQISGSWLRHLRD